MSILELEAASLTQEEMIDKAAYRLLEIEEQMKLLKMEQQKLEDSIWTLTKEEIGTETVAGKKFLVDVVRSELFDWDTETLALGVGVDTKHLPDYIKVKMSVDRSRYKKLTGAERTLADSALTVKCGKPRIKIRG